MHSKPEHNALNARVVCAQLLNGSAVVDEVTQTLLGLDHHLGVEEEVLLCHECLLFTDEHSQVQHSLDSVGAEQFGQMGFISGYDSHHLKTLRVNGRKLRVAEQSEQAFHELLLVLKTVLNGEHVTILWTQAMGRIY